EDDSGEVTTGFAEGRVEGSQAEPPWGAHPPYPLRVRWTDQAATRRASERGNRRSGPGNQAGPWRAWWTDQATQATSQAGWAARTWATRLGVAIMAEPPALLVSAHKLEGFARQAVS